MSQRRAVLLTLLAVALALFLFDVHGSPRQLVRDLRETWSDIPHTRAADSTSDTTRS